MKPNAIFIIGSGRSGTHLLCKSLLGYNNVSDGGYDGYENLNILKDSTISSIMHKELDSHVIKYYEKKIAEANKNKKIFVDQCHTNLFNVDQLRKHFPDAVFFMTERDTIQIVSSYVKNIRKFMVWIEWARVNTVPLPNRFLGITTHSELKETGTHILATQRTLSIKEEIERVYKKHSDVVYKIQFEDMIMNHKTFLEDLDIDIGTNRKFVNIDESVLVKYKTLPEEKQEDINNVTI